MKSFSSKEELIKFFKRRQRIHRTVKISATTILAISIIAILAIIRAEIICEKLRDDAICSIISAREGSDSYKPTAKNLAKLGLDTTMLKVFGYRFEAPNKTLSIEEAFMSVDFNLDNMTNYSLQVQYGLVIKNVIYILSAPTTIGGYNSNASRYDGSAARDNLCFYIACAFIMAIVIIFQNKNNSIESLGDEYFKKDFGFTPLSSRDIELLASTQPIIDSVLIKSASDFSIKAWTRDLLARKLRGNPDTKLITEYQKAAKLADDANNDFWNKIMRAKANGYKTFKKIEQYY